MANTSGDEEAMTTVAAPTTSRRDCVRTRFTAK